MDDVSTLLVIAAIVLGLFAAYNLFHYILYLLVIYPKDATHIGHTLNEFERRQLVEWTPKTDDFLKHDDENRTYDDVFGLLSQRERQLQRVRFSARDLHAPP